MEVVVELLKQMVFKKKVSDKSGWSQEQNDWLLELVAKRGLVVEVVGKNVHKINDK